MNRDTIEIKADETLEDLQAGELKLIQKKKNFRFGMDAVLLADFARIGPGDRVADLGSGTGILPILLISRAKGNHFVGFEIQDEMAEMAGRSIRLNGLEDQMSVLLEDVAMTRQIHPEWRGLFDAAVCNPPYGIPGHSVLNQAKALSTARHQGPETLSHFLSAAYHLLKGKGKLFLVYPAAQMFSLMTAIRESHMEPKHFRLVYPDSSHGANLVLMEAVKDARPLLQPLPPLIIRAEDGSLTEEMRKIYRME